MIFMVIKLSDLVSRNLRKESASWVEMFVFKGGTLVTLHWHQPSVIQRETCATVTLKEIIFISDFTLKIWHIFISHGLTMSQVFLLNGLKDLFSMFCILKSNLSEEVDHYPQPN